MSKLVPVVIGVGRRPDTTTTGQGLKFRRNSAKNFVFASYREKNFSIFRKISFENSKFKKFRPKVTEIRRNLPKFRNEISFPLNTGICNENEMVNSGREQHLIAVLESSQRRAPRTNNAGNNFSSKLAPLLDTPKPGSRPRSLRRPESRNGEKRPLSADRKSTRLNSSYHLTSRMPSSA